MPDNCRNCGAAFESSSIKPNYLQCNYCKAVYPLPEGMKGKLTPQIKKPRQINVFVKNDKLEIQRKWYSGMTIFLTIFAAFWNMSLFFFFSFFNDASIYGFGALHIAAGAFIAYLAATGFLNTTFITIARNKLTVKHRPLWWPGNQTIDADDIIQYYVKKEVSNRDNNSQVMFSLMAILKDHTEISVLKNIDNYDHAAFIEKVIEDYSDIVNVEVEGEFKP